MLAIVMPCFVGLVFRAVGAYTGSRMLGVSVVSHTVPQYSHHAFCFFFQAECLAGYLMFSTVTGNELSITVSLIFGFRLSKPA